MTATRLSSYAAYKGHEAIVRLLLEPGRDKEAQRKDGRPGGVRRPRGDRAAADRWLWRTRRRRLRAAAHLSSLRRSTATRQSAAAARGLRDKEAKRKDGDTPLIIAAINGHEASCGCCSRPMRTRRRSEGRQPPLIRAATKATRRSCGAARGRGGQGGEDRQHTLIIAARQGHEAS